jgi:hypothetical protein
MWLFHTLSWSSFCRFPTTHAWNVFVNENANDLGHASSLVGTCTSHRKRFSRGQRRMTREDWISGVDDGMTSGLARYRAPLSVLKGRTPLRSTWLYSWWRYNDKGVVPCLDPLSALSASPEPSRKRLDICTCGQYITARGCHCFLTGAACYLVASFAARVGRHQPRITLSRRNHDAQHTGLGEPEPAHSCGE